jgi:NitT/TauT family transport system ATP-binding protein
VEPIVRSIARADREGSGQIEISAVQKLFGGESEVIALQDVSLSIARGEFVCLLGPSGCGKSTLLNTIAGFEKPSSGSVALNGRRIEKPGPERGMVFQEYALFPWMTVEQNIAFGLEIKGETARKRREIVDRLIETMGLDEHRRRFPKDLSGGMRQRVAIARVLALDSPVLLMDEPFGALDALTRRTLQDELIRIWSESGKTIVFVTHSIEESVYLADRVVVLSYRPGRVILDTAVALPRPRDPTSGDFNEIKRKLGQIVMKEQDRFEQAVRSAAVD